MLFIIFCKSSNIKIILNSIYLGAELELGALENGNKRIDDNKDLADGYYKLPIVMKNMLKCIIDKYASLKSDVNIIGYNIQGEYISQVIFAKVYLPTSLDNKLSYMNMDASAGYIMRIRRLQKLQYPTSKDDYIALLTIAYNGFETMNRTLLKMGELLIHGSICHGQSKKV
ncbi:hypothetical protein HPULCUR_000176 [Helicostylum pulchrum]|uniref:Uncharacterized protein n=1 Tax=Helicostylum pulchrum TaxID=562976 RepID=A0ABP9XJ44_9FUNG